jgi:hypothetical protein
VAQSAHFNRIISNKGDSLDLLVKKTGTSLEVIPRQTFR